MTQTDMTPVREQALRRRLFRMAERAAALRGRCADLEGAIDAIESAYFYGSGRSTSEAIEKAVRLRHKKSGVARQEQEVV